MNPPASVEFLTAEWCEQYLAASRDTGWRADDPIDLTLQMRIPDWRGVTDTFFAELIHGELVHVGLGAASDPTVAVGMRYPDAIAHFSGGLSPLLAYMSGKLWLDKGGVAEGLQVLRLVGSDAYRQVNERMLAVTSFPGAPLDSSS